MWEVLQEALARLVSELRQTGAVDDSDRDRAACLLAALDGMAVAGVAEAGRMDPERAVRLLDLLLSTLLARPPG